MRISLAVGMVPHTGTMGTHVKVPSGKWKVGHNCKDSILCLRINDIDVDIIDPMRFETPTSVQVKVEKGGTERYILAYLEEAA